MEKKGKGLMVIGKLPNLTSFVIVRRVSVLISLPGPYIYGLGIYGSVSAGREKWPFNVIFFLKVEPPCDQT